VSAALAIAGSCPPTHASGNAIINACNDFLILTDIDTTFRGLKLGEIAMIKRIAKRCVKVHWPVREKGVRQAPEVVENHLLDG
jgi:hypothetical protein